MVLRMDVVDLQEFYGSALGHASRRILAQRIRAHWGSMNGARVLGLGFATPYLDMVREEAQAVLGFMPAELGVSHWPAEGGSATALVDEIDLPLPDSSIDFALVVHGLELTQNLNDMLRELWRVLAPQGSVLFVVPNRRGMWARFDSTPFGHGQPFSRQQLTKMLREAQFSPSGWSEALFVPPIRRAFLVRSAVAWERMGLPPVTRVRRRDHRRSHETGLRHLAGKAGAQAGADAETGIRAAAGPQLRGAGPANWTPLGGICSMNGRRTP